MNQFRLRVEAFGRRYGILHVLAHADGRTLSKGSVSFAEIDGVKVLSTAEHVVDGLAAEKGQYRLSVLPSSPGKIPVYGRPASAIEFVFDPTRVLWRSSAHDVAFLEPVNDLLESPHVAWTNLATEAARMPIVRAAVQNFIRGKTEPFCVMGFPNFGHLRLDGLKTEILSTLPLLCTAEISPIPASVGETRPQKLKLQVAIQPPARCRPASTGRFTVAISMLRTARCLVDIAAGLPFKSAMTAAI